MAAKRVISLAESAWTVRALHAAAIAFPPGAERGCRPAQAAYEPQDFRDDLARGVSAVVPGCVHHALIKADLIESPDGHDAEERLQWVGRTEWEYRCGFDWAGAGGAADGDATRTELVLDGLDTVAEVSLNGQVVGHAASFFFPHRFDIDQAIRAGRNQLSIRFTPPLLHIRTEEARLGARPFNGDQAAGAKWDPFVFIRKPACNLGWDWGPKVATVGIAGGVWIERWGVARIEHVRPLVIRADAERAELAVHVDLAWGGPRPAGGRGGSAGVPRGQTQLAITLRDRTGRVVCNAPCSVNPDQSSVVIDLSVPRPELWWPVGYGEQPLYQLHVELRAGSKPLDEWTRDIGLRTVKLDTAADRWGSAFTLRVNDRPVFCQGANWIPEGLFAGYAGDAVIRTRVRDAAEMHANMLRVWGGGLYEPRAFYDECDRLGILVWQDFMFSCGMYPEEAPYGGESGLIAREARHQLARLSSHPSVALWCGGNETIWGHDKWGWRERLKEGGGQSWGSGYWLDLLPRLCAEVDPSRPYWPNSPWSGVDANGAQRDVLDADHGDRHTWEVDAWGPRPETEGFRSPNASGVPRFCSEFGHQSPPCVATLGGSVHQLARSQRGPGGDARWYDVPISAVFGPAGAPLRERGFQPREYFPRWHYLAQVLQARVVSRGIEWHRVNRPRCGGVLFWQLNDCWAGHSWSAIDAEGRKKPLWFAARRAMSPRLLSIHVVDGVPLLFGVNDTAEAWEGEIITRRVAFEGATLAEHRAQVRIGSRVSGMIADLAARLGPAADPKRELLVAEAEGSQRALHFHLPDRELVYPLARPEWRASVSTPADGRYRLHVRTDKLTRDLVISVRSEPAFVVSDSLHTLLPNEELVIDVRSEIESLGTKMEAGAIVQWVNQFV